MLVEFARSKTDDDGVEVDGGPIAINPESVSAVFASSHDGNTIIRLSDGRGFVVKGTYPSVMGRLAGEPATSPTDD